MKRKTMTRRPQIWKGAGALILLVAALALPAGLVAAPFGGGEPVVPPRPAWSPGAGIGVRDLTAGGDGRLLAAIGDFEQPGFFGAARFKPGGALETAFGKGGYTAPLRVRHGPGLRLRARAVATDGGRVLVAGFQETELGGTAPLLARFRSNGALDRSFGEGGIVAPKPALEGKDPSEPSYGIRGGGTLQDVAVQPGGRIVAAGARNLAGGGRPAALLIAYRRDGTVDTSFADGGRIVIEAPRENRFTGFTTVRALRDGRLLVAGYLRGELALLRLTAEGRPDPGFGGGDGIATPRAGQPRYCCPTPALLGMTANGRILLGGIADRAREEPLLLFRLLPDGSIDPSFGKNGHVAGGHDDAATETFIPLALSVQRDGRIVVAGADERVDRERRVSPAFTVLRYQANGRRLDRSFGKGGAAALPPSQAGGAAAAVPFRGGVVVGGGIYVPEGKTERFNPVLVGYPGAAGAG
jgi:uncharacterized delta-60 repeat protein